MFPHPESGATAPRWGDTPWSPLSSNARRPQGAFSLDHGAKKLALLAPPTAGASTRPSLAPPGLGGVVQLRRPPQRSTFKTAPLDTPKLNAQKGRVKSEDRHRCLCSKSRTSCMSRSRTLPPMTIFQTLKNYL